MRKLLLAFKKNKAFTLIELIITLAIISIISIPMMTFFITNYSIYFKETTKMDALQVASAGMERIMSDLRRAEQTSIVKNNDSSIQMFILEKQEGSLGYTEKLYEYLLQNNVVYQSIDGTKNQLIYNVESFNVDYEEEQQGTVVTVTVKVKTNEKDGYKFELSNSHKIRS